MDVMKALAYIALENRNGAERDDAQNFRSCCRRISLYWFLFCWQKYYQRYLLQFICSRKMLFNSCIIWRPHSMMCLQQL